MTRSQHTQQQLVHWNDMAKLNPLCSRSYGPGRSLQRASWRACGLTEGWVLLSLPERAHVALWVVNARAPCSNARDAARTLAHGVQWVRHNRMDYYVNLSPHATGYIF